MIFGLHWTFWIVFACAIWSLSAYWRPASVALALSWGAAQAIWIYTGEQVPVWFYIPADLLVLVIIYHFRSSRLDWLIAACFPLAWQSYGWSDIVAQWWFLWAVMVFQLILAGPWRSTRPHEHTDPKGSGRQYVEA